VAVDRWLRPRHHFGRPSLSASVAGRHHIRMKQRRYRRLIARLKSGE